ncbi:MAG: metallophosphoesterase [Woeseia sp.]
MKYLRSQNPLRRLAALALLLSLAGSGLAEPWRWSDVPRVVAISDVHGAYDAMVRTLQNAEVLDDDLLWSGGGTHLVVTGDLLDRGPESRQAMDLVMRLEEEAVAAGGQVHLLLGNHEVMNLVGDLRYVAAAEYAAFANDAGDDGDDDEDAGGAENSAATADDDGDGNDALPSGFLAHRRAFAADGKYGAWLLGKPLIVVINDTAFVHGGLSPLVTELGLDGINGDMKARLVEYVTQLGVLLDAGVVQHTDDFYQRPEKLAALPADETRPAELQAAIDTVMRLSDDAIHDLDSPLWYRGNVACSPLIAIDQLSAALKRIDARRVVIGHTPTPARGVLQRLDGRVIEIDTGMLNNYYGGKGHALIIEGDALSVVSESDETASAPVPHPRRIDLLANDVPASDLEKWLATGEIVSSAEAAGRTVVQLRHDGGSIAAVFLPNPRTRGFVPELAAYRLDRLLNLGMVPATVTRTVDGQAGAMQFLPTNAVDESQRSDRREGSSAWCPLAEQWQAMYAFDALTFNPGRLPATMLYGRSDWQLVLVGHLNAFAPRNGRPPYLRDTELALSESWEVALARLTDAAIRQQLGDVLDRRRLNALIERRSELLREARRPGE